MHHNSLRAALDDETDTETYLYASFLEDVLLKGDDHPEVSLSVYGPDDLAVSHDALGPEGFELDEYRVRQRGMETYTVELRASTEGVIPGIDLGQPRSSHDITLIAAHVIYKATATVTLGLPFVEASLFILPNE